MLGEDIKKTAIVLGKKGSLDQAFSLIQTLAKYQRKSYGASQFDSALKAIINEFFDLGRIDLTSQLMEFFASAGTAYHLSKHLAAKIHQLNKFDELILPTINTPQFPICIFYDYLRIAHVPLEVIERIEDEEIRNTAWNIQLYS